MRKLSVHARPHDRLDEDTPRHSDTAATRRATNRRVVLKAAAGMAALSASGIGLVTGSSPAGLAQEADGTRARRYVPADNGFTAADAAQGEWVTFQAEFPFWALGASWDGDVGLWPVVAVQLSQDGSTWTETVDVAAYTDDGGQPTRDGRLFTPLIFTDGPQWVRYQTIDINRVPGQVAGLSFVYIDPTDGPWIEDIEPVGSSERLGILSDDTLAPPEVITREQWGANENWRFDSIGEVWPPEYRTVSHIIIHHTATANRPSDVPNAIRSIYYYHAVEQGWGDIGYNYLVDHNGRIYQGRFGGQDVIGGHSFQFAVGSSGITTIGNFTSVDITEAAKAALVSICAFVGRDLDPLATEDFLEAPDLPVISSHRDVNATTCPGDRLWNDLPEIRTLVAQTLDSGDLDTGLPAGIVPGDRVRVQTDDGSALNLRSTAGGSVIGSLPNDATAWVIDGPSQRSDGNWYRVEAESNGDTGWATAQFLIVDPPLPPGSPGVDYPFGLNLRFTATANLRRSPSASAGLIASVPAGTWAHVMAGPSDGDGYSWYSVRAQGYGDGWVITTAISPSPIDESPDAQFEVGDFVEATQTINIRPRPGLAQGVITTAGAGTDFVISQPPIEVTGHIWYGVYNDPSGGGWVVEDYLREIGAPPAGKFENGDTFRVTSTTNLRSQPTTSGSVLTTMAVGTTGTVVGSPRSASGYTWWQVTLTGGTTGWSIENWLVETDGGTEPPPSSDKFDIDDTFRVTENTNLRSSATTGASVVVVMPAGTTGTVLGGPQGANGYAWWQVRTSGGSTGWAVEDWLVETDDTPDPPPSGKFEIDDAVLVTENLNLRSAASTAGSVIVVLPAGATGTVIGGPTAANGYTWWRIQTSQGTGWVVEDWLEETDGGTEPPPPNGAFEIGDVVRVTERANFRTAAGTSNSVIRVLQVGDTGTIQDGPTNASGFVWWQLQTSSGSGWVIEDVLVEGTGTPPPSGGLPAGTDVEVNGNNLRMRSGPGTGNTVLAVLPTGHQLTVVSGPSTGSGFTWYEVNSATYGTGWVADEFIDEV